MPILGIIASAITGNLVTTSYESIATVTVGGGGSATITFSSIPATYTHLQIRAICKTTAGTSNINSIFGQFNSDTGSNYARHFLNGSGSAAGVGAGTSNSSMFFGTNIETLGTNAFAANVIDILDYANTNKYKTTRSLSGVDANGSGYVQFMSGLWMNTAAVTSITISPNSDDFIQYSQFALYGIKGS
jgi:hypothetical protein